MTLTQTQRPPRSRREHLDLDTLPPSLPDDRTVANARAIAELEREQVFQQTGLRINADGHSERAARAVRR